MKFTVDFDLLTSFPYSKTCSRFFFVRLFGFIRIHIFSIKITGSVLSVAVDGKLAFRQGEKMVQIVEEIGKQLSDASDNANIWWAHRRGLKIFS